MKYLFFVVPIFFTSISAHSKPKEIKIDAKDIGTIQISHEYLGEPIAAPEILTVAVKCKGSAESREAALFRLCKFESYSYDRDSKTLYLKMISGRVIHNSGEVVCDQVDHKSVDMTKACEK